MRRGWKSRRSLRPAALLFFCCFGCTSSIVPAPAKRQPSPSVSFDPALVAPSDGALDVDPTVPLCWKPISSPGELRYRVFVDNLELLLGELGEDGFEGPCTEPLHLLAGRTYSWLVQTFDPDRPDEVLGESPLASFTTRAPTDNRTLFEENFEKENQAWEASEGWSFEEEACAFGHHCVSISVGSGRTARLTSPLIPLNGYQNLALSFSGRNLLPEGASLTIELLFSGTSAELKRFGAGSEPLWKPFNLALCDLTPTAEGRLRITLTGPNQGSAQAALDSIRLAGFLGNDLCGDAVGRVCDPVTDGSCGGGLLCCAQGPTNASLYRCMEPVAGLDFLNPPATPNAPGNGALGCPAPDLMVTDQEMTWRVDEVDVAAESCSWMEGCVDGTGLRKLLRFDFRGPNIGSEDLVLGVPANSPELYHFSDCHGHYHFDGFATYELRDASDAVVKAGRKQAFCMVDSFNWAWPGQERPSFNCFNQGISRGWGDLYPSYLDCQWVDVTGVAPGNYILRVEINPQMEGSTMRPLSESRYDNNVLEVPVVLP